MSEEVHVTTAGELIDDLSEYPRDTPVYFFDGQLTPPMLVLSIYDVELPGGGVAVAIDIGE